MLEPHSRRPPLVLMVAAAFALIATSASATEPTRTTVDCLWSVLMTSSNTLSVEPAPDLTYRVDALQLVRKGVNYTFRDSAGDRRTVGVYVGGEFDFLPPEGGGLPTAMSVTAMPSHNHRYQLTLQGPFPDDWYPDPSESRGASAEAVFSKTHPLYGLWTQLKDRCRIDYVPIGNHQVVP